MKRKKTKRKNNPIQDAFLFVSTFLLPILLTLITARFFTLSIYDEVFFDVTNKIYAATGKAKELLTFPVFK